MTVNLYHTLRITVNCHNKQNDPFSVKKVQNVEKVLHDLCPLVYMYIFQ